MARAVLATVWLELKADGDPAEAGKQPAREVLLEDSAHGLSTGSKTTLSGGMLEVCGLTKVSRGIIGEPLLKSET